MGKIRKILAAVILVEIAVILFVFVVLFLRS